MNAYELLDKALLEQIKESLNNKRSVDNLPTGGEGWHYIILCNKPVPKGADAKGEMILDDLYVWYNGTSAKSVKSRISQHLFRNESKRRKHGISNGIRVTSVKGSLIENHPNVSQNFKKDLDVEGNYYELGIDIREEKWADYEFSVICEEFRHYNGVAEQLFRQHYGQPPLCTSKGR